MGAIGSARFHPVGTKLDTGRAQFSSNTDAKFLYDF